MQAANLDRLLGRAVIVNYHMADIGSNSKKICVLGDWNQFVIREVGDFQIATSAERFFEYRQTAVAGFGAIGLLVSNSNSLKYIITDTGA